MKPFKVEEIDYATAAAFNERTHRHLPKAPPRIQIVKCWAVMWKGAIRAVAILGQPCSPHLSRTHLEVRRLASDGLYGACKKHTEEKGRKCVTYTFENESGASLYASGATCDGVRKAGKDCRKGRVNLTSQIKKVRWILWSEKHAAGA